MHGFGTFIFADGKYYEWFYFNDKKHGFGIFHWANGKRYEGRWFEGKQHGYGILIDKSKKQHGEWKEGQRIKVFKEDEVKQVYANYEDLKNQ